MEILSIHSIIAIVLAAVVQIAFGAFWYSPLLFGSLWMQETGHKMEDCKTKKPPFVQASVVTFITSFALGYLAIWTHIISFFDGAKLGFLCWLGFVATTHYSGVIWAKKPFKVYLIDVGCLLVSLILADIIVAACKTK